MSIRVSAEGHDPTVRGCIIITTPPLPHWMLRDDLRCPACDELSALVDLDPDFGSAEDGRPRICRGCGERLADPCAPLSITLCDTCRPASETAL